VEAEDTIAEVKAKITKQIGIEAARQTLSYDGAALDDKVLVKDAGFRQDGQDARVHLEVAAKA